MTRAGETTRAGCCAGGSSSIGRCLAQVDRWIPVPFDLVSSHGYTSRSFALFAIAGLSLRAYTRFLATYIGVTLPHCESLGGERLDGENLGDDGVFAVEALETMFSAVPYVMIIGISGSRWHGRFWRLLALPVAFGLLSDSITEFGACAFRDESSMLTVALIFEWALSAINGMLLLLMTLRLVGLLVTDPPASASPPPAGASAPRHACHRLVSGFRRWMESDLPAKPDAADARPAPRLPLRLVIAMSLSACIIVLACVAQVCAAVLMYRHGPRLLGILRGHVSVTREALRVLLTSEQLLPLLSKLGPMLDPQAAAASVQAAHALLAWAEDMLSFAGPPFAASLPPSLVCGAILAAVNWFAWNAYGVPAPAPPAAPVESAPDAPRKRVPLGAIGRHSTSVFMTSGYFLAGTPSAAAAVPAAVGEAQGWRRLLLLGKTSFLSEIERKKQRAAALAELEDVPIFVSFYVVPIAVANSTVAFVACSVFASLLAFSLFCDPVREYIWINWVLVSLTVWFFNWLARRLLYRRLISTPDAIVLPRMFRFSDFVYSLTFGPLFGATLVGWRCLLASLCATSMLARTDISLLPSALSFIDPAYSTWRAMLKLHALAADGKDTLLPNGSTSFKGLRDRPDDDAPAADAPVAGDVERAPSSSPEARELPSAEPRRHAPRIKFSLPGLRMPRHRTGPAAASHANTGPGLPVNGLKAKAQLLL
ncbi:hypothetical protein T492DRAFT_1012169 [Pavlovales sp. CCMP2436]|nr:hypothetical protein T492DRAFT_1012169 [Pavlovales sp. CCMP2436]